jgi:hypothetical protein
MYREFNFWGFSFKRDGGKIAQKFQVGKSAPIQKMNPKNDVVSEQRVYDSLSG